MTQWGLDTLFNPAKRHMDEEKRRLQATRQQVGDTSGGKRIDLESGKVRIGKKTDGDEAAGVDAEDTAAEQLAGDATGDATGEASDDPSRPKSGRPKSPAKKATPEKKLSPAQIRAAERRRRTPR